MGVPVSRRDAAVPAAPARRGIRGFGARPRRRVPRRAPRDARNHAGRVRRPDAPLLRVSRRVTERELRRMEECGAGWTYLQHVARLPSAGVVVERRPLRNEADGRGGGFRGGTSLAQRRHVRALCGRHAQGAEDAGFRGPGGALQISGTDERNGPSKAKARHAARASPRSRRTRRGRPVLSVP
ncbi:hypothetical protein DFJ74DRAFT_672081 [Hyaloraphidium curvatum]|nr:hypothetical protein DFJ74DRAFT_672081 [Hyaloraphidium curvatum]